MEGAWQVVWAVVQAVPTFFMGVRLFRTWRNPMAMERGAWVRFGVGVFLLEFILCHGGMFLGALGARSDSTLSKAASVVGVSLFYGLFAAIIGHAFRSPALLRTFVGVMAGRTLAITTGIFGDATALLFAHSVVALVLYMVAVFVSVTIPIPRLGVTREVAAMHMTGTGRGLWVEEPHRALAAGALYFLALGVAEVALLTWLDPRAVARP